MPADRAARTARASSDRCARMTADAFAKGLANMGASWTLGAHSAAVTAMTVWEDTLLTAGWDRKLHVFSVGGVLDGVAPELVASLELPRATALSMAASATRIHLACGGADIKNVDWHADDASARASILSLDICARPAHHISVPRRSAHWVGVSATRPRARSHRARREGGKTLLERQRPHGPHVGRAERPANRHARYRHRAVGHPLCWRRRATVDGGSGRARYLSLEVLAAAGAPRPMLARALRLPRAHGRARVRAVDEPTD